MVYIHTCRRALNLSYFNYRSELSNCARRIIHITIYFELSLHVFNPISHTNKTNKTTITIRIGPDNKRVIEVSKQVFNSFIQTPQNNLAGPACG